MTPSSSSTLVFSSTNLVFWRSLNRLWACKRYHEGHVVATKRMKPTIVYVAMRKGPQTPLQDFSCHGWVDADLLGSTIAQRKQGPVPSTRRYAEHGCARAAACYVRTALPE